VCRRRGKEGDTMTSRDYKEIKGAIDRILTSIVNDKLLNHKQQIAAAGVMMGFGMWFEDYAQQNTENL